MEEDSQTGGGTGLSIKVLNSSIGGHSRAFLAWKPRQCWGFIRNTLWRVIDRYQMSSRAAGYDAIVMNRIHRKFASLVGVVALLFAQLAGSAYACPFLVQSMAESTTTATGEAVVPSAVLDPGAPALCEQHCQYGTQNVNDAPQALAGVALAPAFVVTIAQHVVVAASPATAAQPSRLYAASPPLAIRNCCFRI